MQLSTFLRQNRREASVAPALALSSVAVRFRHPLADLGGRRIPHSDDPKPRAEHSTSSFRRSPRLRRIESVLFLTREPISARKLSQFADLADAGEARTLVRRLNALYDQSGRAFRVEESAGGYLLQTRARFANWIRRCPQTPRELRLSAPTLETLTVIAYRQPAARSEIEAIRGVNCGEILRQLLDRDLVKIAGRSDELGRPYLYETTPRFLQAFGLNRIEDLPTLRPTEAVSEGEASPATTDHVEFQSREGEDEVSVTKTLKAAASEELRDRSVTFVNPFSPRTTAPLAAKKDEDEDEDEDEDWDDDEDEDEDDDLDDEDDELDDEEDEDDLDDEEWEEVDDEDEEEDEDDDKKAADEDEDDEEWDDEEEDEEWEEDDEEDEDWDDDEEEEEEEDED